MPHLQTSPKHVGFILLLFVLRTKLNYTVLINWVLVLNQATMLINILKRYGQH